VYGFFFQAEDGIRDLVRSRGLGDVYKRQCSTGEFTSQDPLEFVDGMSLYRGYFVPSGWDPYGLDYHHWFANLGSKGQEFIDCRCKKHKLDIDRFTTWYDGVISNGEDQGGLYGDTPHGYLHHKLGYHYIYEAVVGATDNCCEALLATWALAEIFHQGIQVEAKLNGFDRSNQQFDFSVIQSLRYHDKANKTWISTSAEFLLLVGEVCGGDDTPIKQTIGLKDEIKVKIVEQYPEILREINTPDLKEVIVTGVANTIIVLSVLEDFATFGAGVIDDPRTVVPAQAAKIATQQAIKAEILRRARKRLRKEVFDNFKIGA